MAAVAGLNGVILDPLFLTLTDPSDPTIPCVLTPPALDVNVVNTRISEALACVEGALADLQAAADALADEVTALSDAVDAYEAAVQAVEDAVAALGLLDLSGLLDAITDLLDQVLAADVVGSDPVRVTQTVRAAGGDLDGSRATTICSDGVTTILGTVLPTEDCSAGDAGVVQPALDAVNGLFDTLPAIDAGDGIALELFGTVADEVAEAADGTVTATSVVEVLRLEVPTLTITPCDVADGLVCSLGVDLDGLTDGAITDVSGVLDGAFATADGAVDAVATVLTDLGATIGVDTGDTVGTTVDTALGVLDTAVDGIDLGGLLSGESAVVPGATVVVDPQLEANHQVTTAAVDTPTTDTPTDGAPTPTNDPTLPNTGGGAALLAVLALGAGAWLWRRREA